MIRALRAQDWSVQVAIHWACALVYGAATDPPALPYFEVIAWTTTLVAAAMTAGYLLNNFADVAGDAYKPRPYFRTPKEARGGAMLALALVGGSLVWVHAIAQSAWLPIIAWGQVLVGLGYSLRPLRFKERGALGLITSAISQRLPAFAMLVVAAPTMDPIAAGLLGAWLTIVGLVFIVEHQLDDLASDLRSGTRTWVTRAGRERGVALRVQLHRALIIATAAVAGLILARLPELIGLSCAALWVAASLVLAASVRRHYARRAT